MALMHILVRINYFNKHIIGVDLVNYALHIFCCD